jgi:hypothetical protein
MAVSIPSGIVFDMLPLQCQSGHSCGDYHVRPARCRIAPAIGRRNMIRDCALFETPAIARGSIWHQVEQLAEVLKCQLVTLSGHGASDFAAEARGLQAACFDLAFVAAFLMERDAAVALANAARRHMPTVPRGEP